MLDFSLGRVTVLEAPRGRQLHKGWKTVGFLRSLIFELQRTFPNFIFDHFFSFLFFMQRPFPTWVDKDAATTCPFASQFPHFVAIHFPLKKLLSVFFMGPQASRAQCTCTSAVFAQKPHASCRTAFLGVRLVS